MSRDTCIRDTKHSSCVQVSGQPASHCSHNVFNSDIKGASPAVSQSLWVTVESIQTTVVTHHRRGQRPFRERPCFSLNVRGPLRALRPPSCVMAKLLPTATQTGNFPISCSQQSADISDPSCKRHGYRDSSCVCFVHVMKNQCLSKLPLTCDRIRQASSMSTDRLEEVQTPQARTCKLLESILGCPCHSGCLR